MSPRYFSLGLAQLLLILLSGWLRRGAWAEIDFGEAWGVRSQTLQFSFYCLAGWFATIVIAIWFAAVDKVNRSMIALFLIVLLPSAEFFLWLALGF